LDDNLQLLRLQLSNHSWNVNKAHSVNHSSPSLELITATTGKLQQFPFNEVAISFSGPFAEKSMHAQKVSSGKQSNGHCCMTHWNPSCPHLQNPTTAPFKMVNFTLECRQAHHLDNMQTLYQQHCTV
jgi:hypothetical protein